MTWYVRADHLVQADVTHQLNRSTRDNTILSQLPRGNPLAHEDLTKLLSLSTGGLI